MSFRLEEATIESIQSHLLTGSLTARSLTESYIARIQSPWAKRLNSTLALDIEGALQTADRLDDYVKTHSRLSGTLHGVVILIKDNILTKGLTTTCGSVELQNYVPTEDATVVKRVREAGGIVLGKTTMPDFATSWFSFSSMSGETRNPYSSDHDAGGSSSGSAAAAAANLATVTIGTDCGGSVRLPASFCNLVGIRSTPGVVPRTGSSALVEPQDTIGPLARTVMDAVTVLDAIAGPDGSDHLSSPLSPQPSSYAASIRDSSLSGMRVGIVTNAIKASTAQEREVAACMSQAVEAMRGAGAETIMVEIPSLDNYLEGSSLYGIGSRYWLEDWSSKCQGMGRLSIPDIVKSGRFHPSLDLLAAIASASSDPTGDADFQLKLAVQDEFANQISIMMDENRLDGLAYPVLQIPPPPNSSRTSFGTTAFPTNTLIASQARLPSVAVPAGFSAGGLPIGIEMVARRWDDKTALRLAYGLEKVASKRKEPTSASGPDMSTASVSPLGLNASMVAGAYGNSTSRRARSPNA